MRDGEVNVMLKKIMEYACISILTVMLAASCAPRPRVEPEPEPEIGPSPPPYPSGFVMKPFHRSMSEEMRKSYDLADEIIIGVLTGIPHDKEDGLVYYFSDFSSFDKETLSWGSPQNVIMQVRLDKFKPEIIRRNEFKRLIDLDKTGICWDYYQGNRSIYLVEGKKNLIFLELIFDEASSASFRNLLDAYPVTDRCRARDVFNLMIRDLVSSRATLGKKILWLQLKEHQQDVFEDKKLSETTIRNATAKAVDYILILNRPGAGHIKTIIKPGDIHHHPGDTALRLTFYRDNKKLTYRLNPGISCYFDLDEKGKLDVYTDSSKKADLEDIVPFVATPMDIVRKMLEMAQVDEEDMLYDLGCGDGRIVITAAAEFGAHGVGIDLDPQLIEQSKANAESAKVEDIVEFRLEDALRADFSEATVVTLYLLMDINGQLRPHLERQLRSGSYVVAHNYPIPGWASRLVDYITMKSEDGEEHSIYLYQK